MAAFESIKNKQMNFHLDGNKIDLDSNLQLANWKSLKHLFKTNNNEL
jgi:hypothetical protein